MCKSQEKRQRTGATKMVPVFYSHAGEKHKGKGEYAKHHLEFVNYQNCLFHSNLDSTLITASSSVDSLQSETSAPEHASLPYAAPT